MEAFIGTDVPSEDTRTGDSYISTHKTPLMNDGTKLGAFHQINDNDYYTIPIQHGATQTIELESKGRVQYSLSESDNCFSEASFVNGSSIYTYKVLMICDTENMTDEIHLTVAS